MKQARYECCVATADDLMFSKPPTGLAHPAAVRVANGELIVLAELPAIHPTSRPMR